jgi:hypothetical protein
MRGTVRPVPPAFNGPFPSGQGWMWGQPALDTLARSCRSSSRRARRIRPGRLLAWPHASQIRLHLRDRARGAIRSQANDGPVTTYKAEQSFSELPGDRHSVSANASKTKPAKLLAVFVVDANETELTIPFAN